MAHVTNTPKRATGKTGATCPESGPYTSGGNSKVGDVIVFLRKGEPFPPNFEGNTTTWTLVSGGHRLSDGRLVKETSDKEIWEAEIWETEIWETLT
jgi:hypothetical protein